MNYTRVLVFKRRVDFVEDVIELLDTKFNKTVEIPFNKSSTLEQNVYDWLDSKNIPYIGAMLDHVICEFEGPIPSHVLFNVPRSLVLEISTVKNDAGVYQLKIHAARYNQSVYTEIKDGRDTIDNAYQWLEDHGYTLVSADVDSLKMYVVTDVMKPLYTTPELV